MQVSELGKIHVVTDAAGRYRLEGLQQTAKHSPFLKNVQILPPHGSPRAAFFVPGISPEEAEDLRCLVITLRESIWWIAMDVDRTRALERANAVDSAILRCLRAVDFLENSLTASPSAANSV